MSYNMHTNPINKNLVSTTQSGGYSINNMKEEPNAVPNIYSNIMNIGGQEDMSVIRLQFFLFLN